MFDSIVKFFTKGTKENDVITLTEEVKHKMPEFVYKWHSDNNDNDHTYMDTNGFTYIVTKIEYKKPEQIQADLEGATSDE